MEELFFNMIRREAVLKFLFITKYTPINLNLSNLHFYRASQKGHSLSITFRATAKNLKKEHNHFNIADKLINNISEFIQETLSFVKVKYAFRTDSVYVYFTISTSYGIWYKRFIFGMSTIFYILIDDYIIQNYELKYIDSMLFELPPHKQTLLINKRLADPAIYDLSLKKGIPIYTLEIFDHYINAATGKFHVNIGNDYWTTIHTFLFDIIPQYNFYERHPKGATFEIQNNEKKLHPLNTWPLEFLDIKSFLKTEIPTKFKLKECLILKAVFGQKQIHVVIKATLYAGSKNKSLPLTCIQEISTNLNKKLMEATGMPGFLTIKHMDSNTNEVLLDCHYKSSITDNLKILELFMKFVQLKYNLKYTVDNYLDHTKVCVEYNYMDKRGPVECYHTISMPTLEGGLTRYYLMRNKKKYYNLEEILEIILEINKNYNRLVEENQLFKKKFKLKLLDKEYK